MFQLEMASFEEKITLGELEVAKAEERVKELTYEKARFQVQYIQYQAKLAEQQALAMAQQQAGTCTPPPQN